MNKSILTAVVLLGASALAWGAESSKGSSAENITAVAIGGGSASVTVGGIENAEMDGVAVINGKVYIDGEAVPAGATRYRSKKGNVYTIRRGPEGVAVESESSANGGKP